MRHLRGGSSALSLVARIHDKEKPFTSFNDDVVILTSKETCRVKGDINEKAQKRRGNHNANHHEECVPGGQGAETHWQIK
jgi:hypothetical protein